MWVGGAEMWGEVYLFSTCVSRRDAGSARAPSALRNFSTAPGAAGKRRSAHSGERGREAARWMNALSASPVRLPDNPRVVIDPEKRMRWTALDDGSRWIMAPCVVSTLLVDRLAAHFEKYTASQSGVYSPVTTVSSIINRKGRVAYNSALMARASLIRPVRQFIDKDDV